MEFELMTTKKKSKKGTVSPVMEVVLINALKLWQSSFIQELDQMKAEGKRPMFHPNWTSLMMQEFGIEFGIEELRNTQPILED
jgi:hypothetical protein